MWIKEIYSIAGRYHAKARERQRGGCARGPVVQGEANKQRDSLVCLRIAELTTLHEARQGQTKQKASTHLVAVTNPVAGKLLIALERLGHAPRVHWRSSPGYGSHVVCVGKL